MAFDGGDLLSGGGGGLVGAVLTFLGFRERMATQDKRIEALEKDTVYKDVHAECSRSWHDALARIDSKLDILLTARDEKK